ncbi:hypothetical protein K438DRAFT_1778491 [Mycena galopus ATCC 62051]|nr:hypothetical protein K438DRAFT_1778491 [Mycena galopus ATCC 62051]
MNFKVSQPVSTTPKLIKGARILSSLGLKYASQLCSKGFVLLRRARKPPAEPPNAVATPHRMPLESPGGSRWLWWLTPISLFIAKNHTLGAQQFFAPAKPDNFLKRQFELLACWQTKSCGHRSQRANTWSKRYSTALPLLSRVEKLEISPTEILGAALHPIILFDAYSDLASDAPLKRLFPKGQTWEVYFPKCFGTQ